MTRAPLLTQNELSRQLHITPSRISRLLQKSGLEPDFIASQVKLFRPARVEAIGRTLNGGAR
jgi:plasmid maintenance system antidote protein VapI